MKPGRPVYYHATKTIGNALSILSEGFRVWFEDPEIGRYAIGGNLGSGVYLSEDFRIALWFGPILFAVQTIPGTRILNVAGPASPSVLDSLGREFGHNLFRQPFWKVIPPNKHLRGDELVALVQHHYHAAWGKPASRTWNLRRKRSIHQLDQLPKLLRRYGYHGYGHPSTDNGYVIFDPARLKVAELVSVIPSREYKKYWNNDFREFTTVEELRAAFPPILHSRLKR